LRFHVVHPIQQLAFLEVALERSRKLGSNAGRFKETFQLPNPSGMPHFAQGLGFDLTDSLACNLELPADFFQRSAVAVDEAESLFEDLPFSVC
jgi:hypothetical protein